MSAPDLFGAATRHEQMMIEFVEFNRAHPEVWRYFCANSLRLIRRGRNHYGAQAVMEVIRYHYATSETAEQFKINNNHIPFYSRAFGLVYPEHADFFSRRIQRSHESAPRDGQVVDLRVDPDWRQSFTPEILAEFPRFR